MAYYLKVLRPDEKVLYLGRLHWLIYGGGLAVAVAGATVLILSGVASFNDGQTSRGLAIAALLIFALATVLLIFRAVVRVSTEIVVTDRRVIYKTGLISRRTVEMNTSKIETVDVAQNIVGRMLGYGTVLIRGTGSTFEPLWRVADPLALRNAILVG